MPTNVKKKKATYCPLLHSLQVACRVLRHGTCLSRHAGTCLGFQHLGSQGKRILTHWLTAAWPPEWDQTGIEGLTQQLKVCMSTPLAEDLVWFPALMLNSLQLPVTQLQRDLASGYHGHLCSNTHTPLPTHPIENKNKSLEEKNPNKQLN